MAVVIVVHNIRFSLVLFSILVAELAFVRKGDTVNLLKIQNQLKIHLPIKTNLPLMRLKK